MLKEALINVGKTIVPWVGSGRRLDSFPVLVPGVVWSLLGLFVVVVFL